MHILYKITYLPHIGTNYPKYYIGSKYNFKGNYFGSVSSSSIPEYTNGETLKKWWSTRDKKDFKFEILKIFEQIDPGELILQERKLHDELNVLSNEYFNSCKALKGFVSSKKSVETKIKLSNSLKKFYSSPEGQCLASKQAEKRKGKKRPDLTRRNTGNKHSETTKQKIGLAALGRIMSEEQRSAISRKMKGLVQPKETCIVCGTTTTKANIAKHHNEKCKQK